METQLGKPATLSITAKLYLQIVCKHQLVGCTNTRVFQLHVNDTPTPCLLATTGRRLRPPTGLHPVLAPPNHPYMIIRSPTSVHL